MVNNNLINQWTEKKDFYNLIRNKELVEYFKKTYPNIPYWEIMDLIKLSYHPLETKLSCLRRLHTIYKQDLNTDQSYEDSCESTLQFFQDMIDLLTSDSDKIYIVSDIDSWFARLNVSPTDLMNFTVGREIPLTVKKSLPEILSYMDTSVEDSSDYDCVYLVHVYSLEYNLFMATYCFGLFDDGKYKPFAARLHNDANNAIEMGKKIGVHLTKEQILFGASTGWTEYAERTIGLPYEHLTPLYLNNPKFYKNPNRKIPCVFRKSPISTEDDSLLFTHQIYYTGPTVDAPVKKRFEFLNHKYFSMSIDNLAWSPFLIYDWIERA